MFEQADTKRSGGETAFDAALVRLAKFERERRVADALVRVAEQAGETLDLRAMLDRVCRLTVELVPADRATVYLHSNRVNGYVPIAMVGTPAHVVQRFSEKYYYGAKRASGDRPRTPLGDELATVGIGYCTLDDAPTPEARTMLEESECYAACLVSLRPVRGSIHVGLHQPPGFDETAIRIMQGIARQTASLVQHARLLDKTQRAARVRGGLAALAAAVNLEADPARIAAVLSHEAGTLFRVDATAVLLSVGGDGLRVIGSQGLGGDGRHLSPHDAELLQQAFRDGTTVFQNDLEQTSPLRREFGIKSALLIPLIGARGLLGCLLLGHTERRHPFSQEIADEVAVLGPIASAAVERAELFERLTRSEAHFRSLIENASDMIGVIGPDGLRYQSPSIERVLGIPPAELAGWKVVDAAHPDDRRSLQVLLTELVTGAKPSASAETRIRHADGTWRVLEWSARRSADPANGVPVVIVNARDVTERKRADQALAEARDEALTAARLKSEFLTNMSHEIRTPMNGVIGMAALLAQTALTGEQREFTDTIRSSGEALLTVINDILDFSKIEAGKMTIECLPFDLRSVLEEIAELLAPSAFEKNLELTCMLPPGLPECLVGDPHRLRQVLTNLIGNAIKFTERGSVSVGVELAGETDAEAHLRFTVRDTGIGIPADRQALIFESFAQADGSMTRRYGGTGLGLSISRRLVDLMGGTLGLESEPGRGSTFWVDMRFPKRSHPVSAGRTPAPLAGRRVLVVDDFEMNRRILCESLRSWGCRADEAASGAEAVATLRASLGQQPFDLVIIDREMPELDGEATGALIRAIPPLAALPLVLLTSRGTRGSAEELRARGFVAGLAKPVRQAQLLDVLGQVVGRGGRETLAGPRVGPRSEPALGLRVLLAEDDPVNRKIALRMLARFGCHAHAVGNGREAVAALEDGDFDLVLMDVQMPELDGREATARIREREAETGRHVPIIAMTADAMQGDRQRCLDAGMDGYLSKPVEPDDLRRALEPYVRVVSYQEADTR